MSSQVGTISKDQGEMSHGLSPEASQELLQIMVDNVDSGT
jgi:hypothetical protein